MCMIYISGFDRKRAKFYSTKKYFIGGGVIKKTEFKNNLSTIKYVYTITDIDKNIAIDIKVMNYTKFEYFITSIPGKKIKFYKF